MHDHVVRALHAAGAPGRDGRVRALVMLHKPVEEGAHATVVAFLHRVSTRDVLQTLALPLDHCTSP